MQLSKPQQLICDMVGFAGAEIATNCSSILFDGKKSVGVLQYAVNALFQLNDALRIQVREQDGVMTQTIRAYREQAFEVLQFEDDTALHCFANEWVKQPIQYGDNLCEIKIVILPGQYGILTKLHHLISDAWTFGLLFTQFNEILNGQQPAAYSYFDYCESETAYRNSKRFLKDREYFRSQIEKCESLYYISNKSEKTFRAARKVFVIDSEKAQLIRTFSQSRNFSVFTVFMFALSIYISMVNRNAERFFIGTTVLNRNTDKELHTAGMFVNTVPCLAELDFQKSVIENLEQIEESLFSVFRHQKFNYDDLSTVLSEAAYKSRVPSGRLYDVMLSYMNAAVGQTDADFHTTWYFNGVQNESLQINIDDRDRNGVYQLHYDYQTDKLRAEDVERLHNRLMHILFEVLNAPEKKLSNLSLLTKAEQQQLLCDFNDTAVLYDKSESVYDLIERQVKLQPEKIAVVAADRMLNYRELSEDAGRIAKGLLDQGVKPGDLVAFCLPRDSRLLCALLGILKAGAAYLPLDPQQPKERLDFVLSDSCAKLCVNEDNYASLLAADAVTQSVKTSGDCLCYCIYTSGSTGTPKGTLLTHKNVVNYIQNGIRHMCGDVLTPDCETVLSVTSVGFDIFVTESLLPLANGKTVLLANERQAQFGADLYTLLSEHSADVIQTTPSKMRALSHNSPDKRWLGQLKCIVLGGETLDKSLLEQLQTVTSARIFNVYGPTEATVWATFAQTDDPDDITVGKPLANTDIYILDNCLRPVPVGVTGELCIAGDGVGKGYLKRPELTAEKFIDNPFGEGRLYKTGDLACWREDGNIVFIGRNDFQVKINGQRTEPGEIEAALSAVEGIESAAVIVRNEKTDRQLLCAYYTGTEMTASSLRRQLSKTLPRYMVPQMFVRLDSMPLTVSGKLNRKALPEVDLCTANDETDYVAPQTTQQELLISTAQSVLKIEQIGISDNFFDCGGDSLRCIALISLLEQQGYTLSAEDIFKSADMAELAEKLRPVKAQSAEAIDYPEKLPLTAAQTEIYTAQAIAPDSPLYNIPYVIKVQSPDVERLQKAVDKMLERHEILRTRFEHVNGELMQTVDEDARCTVERIDGAITDFIQPFDLAKAPLIRVGYQHNTILFDLHHIVADGSSMPVFFRELNDFYMGRTPDALPLPYNYFALTQKEQPEAQAYWLNRFADGVPQLNMRTDFSRSSAQGVAGKTLYHQMPQSLDERIAAFCKSESITPFVYYCGAFQILLQKYSGQEDIVVGTPMSGRKANSMGTIGMFVRTLPLRCKPEGGKTVARFFREVRESSVDAVRHSEITGSDVFAKTGRQRLFDVMFTYQSEEMTTLVFGDEPAELVPVSPPISKYDFDFGLYPRKDGAVLTATFNTSLYTCRTVEKWMRSYEKILSSLLDTDRKIQDISVLEEAEKDKVLYAFNNTAVPYDKSQSVYDLFEQQTAASPDIPRITDGDKAYTFADLRLAAEKTDAFIRSRVGSTKQVIGVLCDRSFLQLGAIYGIVRGGNAYLPILPDYPPERIRTILEASGCKLVLAQKQYQHLAEQACAMEEILRSALPVPESVPAAKADDLLYVIYTSGSTGTPKGAMVTNRSAVNRIRWMANRFFDTSSVIMLKTPYSFDVSVWEIFAFAMYGFSLYILPPGEHYRQTSVLAHIAKGTVTDLHFVPTVFEQFLTALRQDEDPRSKLRSLRHIILSGESVSAREINIFHQYHDGQVSVHNLYGPAECTVDVTAYTCAGTETDPIPIGKPIDNTQIYIVDKYLQPVPVGVTGELCIAGDGVGEGYLNRPELTAEKFIGNPFGEGRLYKTGDLAYWREDGNIVFVGRNDLQFKLNGQRIELGEIEAALSAVEGIESAAMTVRKAETGRQLLCAYYTGTEISGTDLRIQIGKVLPRYMVPQVFVRLESMPINASGKLDRTVLSELSLPAALPTQAIEEPLNETERAVIGIFRRILKTDQVGRTTDFTEIGGTSLDVVQALSQEPLTKISASAFLNNPTPADLAKLITAEDTVIYGQNGSLRDITFQNVSPLYVPENADAAYVLFSYAGGNAASYTALVHAFREQNSSVALFFCDWLTSEQLKTAADEIRTIANAVPVRFYSHCAGVVTAMKLIDILNKNSIIVEEYICGANIPPRLNSRMIHVWKYTPDFVLLHILRSAGLNTDGMTDQMISAFLRQFRQNTAENAAYFNRKTTKLPCPVKSVIATGDFFTKNYRLAKQRWEQYTDEFRGVLFFDTEDHYFNNTLAFQLAQILKKESSFN